ncbi:type II toxin-antitoxin system MqsR family toxin [Agrobacterium sp. rho-13.3]|jgi:motility quorum-sensing regulator/GCU-specific mRNA interferase toxin|uniref:type II toxin-antitoxin system MqsR family toxin n=1 Tax=Agrobacterium sp. rho-13.3 TaxID=3072980 RepID=UPI002A1006DA|nr:type II toxin-antitoxin system MqsR family toxin [Agrobacterium sp. rho-13.3]MDX8308773.1 type II toxin-antitoxin system MqsR family toxin [Agrobacterium sp. rho-13.3]
MEKRIAHYSLQAIIAIVKQRKAAVFTKTAIDGGRRMDLTVAEMVEVICKLNNKCLYKSMTTHSDNTVWQDVYHADTKSGKAYIKLTLRADGALVIQFKELQP